MKMFILIFLVSLSVQAKVQVAFIQMRDYYGNIVQLEPGGRFAHSAISYKGKWLQAHPYWGVQHVTFDKVQKMGEVLEILEVPGLEELDEAKVAALLGKPFDHGYIWDDEKIYCSELIAKLLDLKPVPMVFSETWPAEYQALNGLPGLSPDGVYRNLSQLISNSFNEF